MYTAPEPTAASRGFRARFVNRRVPITQYKPATIVAASARDEKRQVTHTHASLQQANNLGGCREGARGWWRSGGTALPRCLEEPRSGNKKGARKTSYSPPGASDLSPLPASGLRSSHRSASQQSVWSTSQPKPSSSASSPAPQSGNGAVGAGPARNWYSIKNIASERSTSSSLFASAAS